MPASFEIAFVNNMPDAALAGTERRIVELLDAVAQEVVERPEGVQRDAPPRQHEGTDGVAAVEMPLRLRDEEG